MTEQNLPPAELDVMSCVWRGIHSAAEIRTALQETRPLSHSSVCTLLGRLENKGLLERRRADKGKAFLYYPNPQAEKATHSLLTRLRDRVFAGSGVALVSSLLESHPPTDEELEQLQQLLDQLRQQKKSRRSLKRAKRKSGPKRRKTP